MTTGWIFYISLFVEESNQFNQSINHSKGKQLLFLLFLTFSALVANPKKVLYTVANPARGLLNREKKKDQSGN